MIVHAAIREPDLARGGALLRPFLSLCLAVPLAWVLSQHLLIRFGQRMVYELRLELTESILATPLRRIEELGPPRLLAALTNDIVAISQGFLQVPELVISLAIVVGGLVYLGWLSPLLFLLLVGVIAAGVVTYQLPVIAGTRRFHAARQQQDRLFGHFRALTEGIKQLMLHWDRSRAFVGLVAGTGRSLVRHYVAANTIFAVAASWGQMLFFLTVGLFVFAVPRWWSVESGSLVGYVLILLYMMGPLRTILDSLPALGQAGVAIDKVDRLGLKLGSTPAAPRRSDVGDAGAATEGRPVAAWSTLRMVGVTFRYGSGEREGDFVVGPFDLAFRPGELVFVTGGNGSGKTTFAKLLTGLYSPDGGTILLDGRPVDDATRAEHRQRFSVTFSDAYVFDELLGLEGPGLDRRASEYLERFGLSRKVRAVDGVWSTTALSQGQRKRLALVMAYLEDRPVYVFDEWAADQDPAFREIFYRRLLPELRARGKLVVAISHDDRYYSLADRILRFEDGMASITECPSSRVAPAG